MVSDYFILFCHSVHLIQEALEGHLRIQLQYCDSQLEGDCPLLTPRAGVDALHAHCALADQLSLDQTGATLAYASQVWNLCVALWGNLPDLGM
jgi:nuclear pore complex protein Nup98-Nup96